MFCESLMVLPQFIDFQCDFHRYPSLHKRRIKYGVNISMYNNQFDCDEENLSIISLFNEFNF